MTDHPMIFSAPMVRAILEGRKTMTRRVLKDQYPHARKAARVDARCRTWDFFDPHPDKRMPSVRQRHYGSADAPCFEGDLLWVKEAWRTEARFDHLSPRDVPKNAIISYEADYLQEPNDGCRGRYRHARFMMRHMSRITVPVTAVKVERLNDISEEDIIAEGVCHFAQSLETGAGWPSSLDEQVLLVRQTYGSCRQAFHHLWADLHGSDSWAANPWVAAISFERVQP
ncbi:MAG: hypothetical protein ABFD96_05880 [Armatimonadia bacterium]